MSENIKQMSFEQYLDEYGELVYSNVGVSMMPMIRQGKDTFTLKKKTERCRKHDVVLFKRGKSYVLHRVVKVLKDGYMVRGDTCPRAEYVPESNVIAVMTGFTRNGRNCDLNSLTYKIYIHTWSTIYPVRRLAMGVKSKLSRRKGEKSNGKQKEQ